MSPQTPLKIRMICIIQSRGSPWSGGLMERGWLMKIGFTRPWSCSVTVWALHRNVQLTKWYVRVVCSRSGRSWMCWSRNRWRRAAAHPTCGRWGSWLISWRRTALRQPCPSPRPVSSQINNLFFLKMDDVTQRPSSQILPFRLSDRKKW